MLTSFGALYAGYIDMENVGYEGAAANDRWYADDRLREVETFGAPMLDADANRALFEEQIEIIPKAYNEESFAHRGRYYTLPPEVPYRGYQLPGGDSPLSVHPRARGARREGQ
jgi:hypothetical protein